ncbi:MAG: dihydrodipicolinate synthase family protein [Thermoleophilaceae bacterium]|nr:dihydrodipicolinate synthase family protein [Thermoleophilaceae bacterium]
MEGVKQANGDSVAMIDGLQLYAGDDDMLAKVLDLGGTGGITVASHIVGPQMRRMVDEPSERAAINEQLQDIFAALGVTTNPIPVKAAMNLLGFEVGGLRMPLVEASDDELAVIRTALERHQLLTRTVI